MRVKYDPEIPGIIAIDEYLIPIREAEALHLELSAALQQSREAERRHRFAGPQGNRWCQKCGICESNVDDDPCIPDNDPYLIAEREQLTDRDAGLEGLGSYGT